MLHNHPVSFSKVLLLTICVVLVFLFSVASQADETSPATEPTAAAEPSQESETSQTAVTPPTAVPPPAAASLTVLEKAEQECAGLSIQQVGQLFLAAEEGPRKDALKTIGLRLQAEQKDRENLKQEVGAEFVKLKAAFRQETATVLLENAASETNKAARFGLALVVNEKAVMGGSFSDFKKSIALATEPFLSSGKLVKGMSKDDVFKIVFSFLTKYGCKKFSQEERKDILKMLVDQASKSGTPDNSVLSVLASTVISRNPAIIRAILLEIKLTPSSKATELLDVASAWKEEDVPRAMKFIASAKERADKEGMEGVSRLQFGKKIKELTESLFKPVTNKMGMKLIEIPAGNFMMGSENGDYGEKPIHPVQISKPFCLGAYEVTQGQWKEIMKTAPWAGRSDVKSGDDYPAVYITWSEAEEFCKKLSSKMGKKYRLPTEAEWEYVCRSGTTTEYSFGDAPERLGDYAWYEDNAEDKREGYAHRVGQKRPNPCGLHDMHGNVAEWCEDRCDRYYYKRSPVVDPPGGTSSTSHVFRGGSWSCDAKNCRSAYRGSGYSSYRATHIGFRVACGQ